jgi:hypothetical protein
MERRGVAQLVARYVRGVEAVGSNPITPTKITQTCRVYGFYLSESTGWNFYRDFKGIGALVKAFLLCPHIV